MTRNRGSSPSTGLRRPNPEEREFKLKDKDFRFLTQAVSSRTGIVLGDNKRDMVYARLAKRLRTLGLNSFEDYIRLIEGPDGPNELGSLVNALTTNLTHFFRETHHFDHLGTTALPEVTERARQAGDNGRLRIWSAGCSSGMEPYSIAMVMSETLPQVERMDARILATDIDTDMLERGRRGIYRASDSDGIPDNLRGKYVGSVAGGREAQVEMADRLKRLIAFKTLNLMGDWPMRGPFDIIFCRNVVIYFDKPTQAKLFDRYAELLRPGGFLYIGHSESLFNVTNRFKLVGRTIYQRVA